MPSLDDVRARWRDLTSFESTRVGIAVAVLTGALTFLLSFGALSIVERAVPYSSILGVATTLSVFVCCYAAVCYGATLVLEKAYAG